MKNLNLIFLALFTCLTSFAQEVNINNYTVLTVKTGKTVGFAVDGLQKDVPARIINGNLDTIINMSKGWYVKSDFEFIPTTDSVFIYGDVAELYCQCAYENITGIDPTHNPMLRFIKADRNSISEIDLSNNPDLWYLCIFNNKLKSLDLSHNPRIKVLYVDGNNWTTEEFDKMMCSLPDRSGQGSYLNRNLDGGGMGLIETVYDTKDKHYNDFMAANSENAKAKNWKVANGSHVALPETNGTYECPTVGIENVVEAMELNVFPNPASDILNISCNEIIKSVSLINILGQEVYHQNIGVSNVQINVANYLSGNYILKIETLENVIIKNIILQ